MGILAYIIAAATAFAVCGLAFKNRRKDACEIRLYIRRTAIVFVSMAFAVCLAAACIMCCYSSLVGCLKGTLPVGAVNGLKYTVRLLLGGGSAVSALQTLLIFSFMLGFLGCTVLGLGGVAFRYIFGRREKIGGAERERRVKKAEYDNYINRTFLVYERYNS